MKKLIAVILSVLMIVPMFAGCANDKDNDTGGLKIIRIGTHAQQEDDPYWVDSITGVSPMNADKKKAAEAALTRVRENLNVEIQFLQYPSSLTQLLLQTVLAGDPFCELAIMWNGCQGNILAQNILQPLDKYASIFLDDPDGAWILPTKTFGHYYMMNRDLLYTNTWPICYNINMIEAVPSLKDENGRTIYPTDLYYSGEWTWSNFKDYISKIKTFYSGKKAASGNEIKAFNTNYNYFAQFALHSVGACVYDGESMKFDTDAGIRACEFVDELITNELVCCLSASKNTPDAGWLRSGEAFQNGESVFTNCARWKMDDASAAFAARGEGMGIVPFPYPDGTNPITDENTAYRHMTPMADSVGLLRGIDEETSRLALEAYKMYKVEFYKALGGVESIEEYMIEQADDEALAFGIDIFHPEIGERNLEIWIEFGKSPINEYSEACNVSGTWGDILGKSIYGISGFPKYRTAVEANKQSIYKKLDVMSEALNKSGAVDAVKPSVSKKEVISLPNGTDPKTIEWSKYIKASDNADGDYEIKQEGDKFLIKANPKVEKKDDGKGKVYDFEEKMTVDYSAVDFNTIGVYTGGLKVSVEDNGGNVAEASFEVLIYDKENTDAPTLEAKEEIPEVARETDVSTINWGKYVESAKDSDGLDISGNISADTGWLDVTAAGEYPVALVATDYVGNSTAATITVRVK